MDKKTKTKDKQEKKKEDVRPFPASPLVADSAEIEDSSRGITIKMISISMRADELMTDCLDAYNYLLSKKNNHNNLAV